MKILELMKQSEEDRQGRKGMYTSGILSTVGERKMAVLIAGNKQQNMTPEQRLHYHQQKSAPLMDGLKDWLSRQFDDKKVEPNSALWQAISYMLKH